MIGGTPGGPALTTDRRTDMALADDDMTQPTQEPDSGAPMTGDEFLGRDGGADGGADEGAGTGDGPGLDDPTTDADEDPRFA